MVDFLDVIRSEGARFVSVLRDAPATARVPSCPGWRVSDLVWHLAEVQHFWASIVENRPDGPETVPPLTRPDEDQLLALFAHEHDRLVTALESSAPGDPCWSWYAHGHEAGWVMRRQAHEAVIHRVDAELAADDPTPIDAVLAADGVDEILTTMLDATDIPDWSRFETDGATAAVVTPSASWSMALGRFLGTSPETGNSYDDPALRLGPVAGSPSVTITGSAADVDLWLWGRGGTDHLDIAGDPSLVAHIRGAAAAATQ